MKKKSSLIRAELERASRFMFTRIISSLARTMRHEELSIPQLATLHLVDEHGSMRQAALGAELGLSASAVSRLVDSLVSRDLLCRRETATDRRARVIELAPHGRELVAQLGESRVDLLEDVTRTMPSGIVHLMIDNFERLREARRSATRGEAKEA